MACTGGPVRSRRLARRHVPTVIAAGLVAVLLLAACGDVTGGSGAGGSGTVATETRDVRGFSRIDLDGSGELTVTQTGTESLAIEAEDDVLPLLTSEVRDGVLVLGPRPATILTTTRPIVYRVTVDDLDGLALRGSGDVTASEITTGELGVEIDGSGTVTTSGSAGRQDVRLSGSGEYRGQDLESTAATVEISGSGGATVRVSDRLDVSISGSGGVTYLGDPAVTQDVSGSGEVRRG